MTRIELNNQAIIPSYITWSDGLIFTVYLHGPDDSTCSGFTIFRRNATGEKPLIIEHSVTDGGSASELQLEEIEDSIRRWGEDVRVDPFQNPEFQTLWKRVTDLFA